MTPDTTGYLLLGLTMIAVIVGSYTFSLVYRMRKVAQQIINISE
jgi:hypothetical protein